MSSRNSATIDWPNASYGKRHTDNQLIRDLEKHGLIAKWEKLHSTGVLSLSGPEPIFENNLIAAHPRVGWDFRLIERNPPVHKRLDKHLINYVHPRLKAALKEKYLKKNMSYSMETTPKPCSLLFFFRNYDYNEFYSLVYWDCMGTVASEKFREHEVLLTSGRTTDEFAFAITLSSARGRPETVEVLSRLSKRKPFKFDFGEPVGDPEIFRAKTKGFVLYMIEQAKMLGWKSKLISFYQYQGLTSTEYKFLFHYKRM